MCCDVWRIFVEFFVRNFSGPPGLFHPMTYLTEIDLCPAVPKLPKARKVVA